MHILLSCLIERSSTRLHAPPGGVSSISFGDYVPPHAQKQQAAVPQAVSRIVAPKVDPSAESSFNMRKASLPSAMNGSTMTNTVSDENRAPVTGRRIQHPPGGRSSIVIG